MKDKLSQSEPILCPKNSDTDYLHDYIELLKKGIPDNMSGNVKEQIDTLQNQVNNLSIKFDVWQSQTENILATSQNAMSYDNYLITCVALGLALFGIWLQKWFSESKIEAVKGAIQEIEDKIAEGLFPDESTVKQRLIETIINSPEFHVAVRKSTKFVSSSSEGEAAKAERVIQGGTRLENASQSSIIDLEDINRAEETAENGINETESQYSGNIKATENTPKEKGE